MAVAAGLGPAAAAPIEHDTYTNEFEFSVANFCGDMPVRIYGDFHGTFTIVAKGRDHLPHFKLSFHGVHVYTNLATGLALTSLVNTIDKEQSVTDNGDGTLTIRSSYTGHDALYGPDGERVGFLAGTTRSVLVVNHAGTPFDPSDDLLLSQEVVGEHGNIPDAEFCDIFREATAG